MIINHNISAINAFNKYQINVSNVSKHLERISSGLKINRAADDAAGLGISEKMRAQIRGLYQAARNAQDGINLIRTAEGYLGQITSILQRIRELAVQSATGTYTDEDRVAISTEVRQLVNEIDRIASQAQFNTIRLLRGALRRPYGWTPNGAANVRAPSPGVLGSRVEGVTSAIPQVAQEGPRANKNTLPPARNTVVPGDVHDFLYTPTDPADKYAAGGLYIHVGANMDERIKLYIENNSAMALGLRNPNTREIDEDVKMLNIDAANRAISKLDRALNYVNKQRADLGAMENRLVGIVVTNNMAAANIQAAESQIRDANMAKEMSELLKSQILTRASAAMLAQSLQLPRMAIQLLE